MSTHIDQKKAERFAAIFSGRKDAWGMAPPEGGGRTIREEVTLEHYRRHLLGEESLGVFPLLPDSTCRFGAVDIDRKDPEAARAVYEALKSLGFEFGVHMEQSRGKGYHVWLFVDDPVPARDMQVILRRAVRDAGLPEKTEIFPKQADAATVEFGNYINLPYFGETDGPRMMLTDGQMEPMPLTRFLTLCRPLPATTVRAIASGLSDDPAAERGSRPIAGKWIVDCLSGVPEGQRNETAAKLVGYLQSRGIPEDVTLNLLASWADKCDPPMDHKELGRVVTGIYRRYLARNVPLAGASRRFDVEPLAAFMKRAPEAVEWLIEPFIPKGGMALISGDPGAGKTWLALDAAISVASGRDWLGRYRTAQGPVILIDEETTHAGLSDRLNRLMLGNALDAATLPIYIALRQGLNLSDGEQARSLAAVIDRVRPALVIFDPFAEIHDASENSADEVARVFRAIREAGRPHHPAFVVIHHNRKNDQTYRGSSHIEATLDARLSIEQVDDYTCKVRHTKARYSEAVDTFAVKRQFMGDEVRLVPVDLPKEAAGGDKGRSGPAVDRAVREIEEFFRWRDGALVPKADLLAALMDDGISQASTDAALLRLQKQGKIVREPDPHNKRHRLVGWVRDSAEEVESGVAQRRANTGATDAGLGSVPASAHASPLSRCTRGTPTLRSVTAAGVAAGRQKATRTALGFGRRGWPMHDGTACHSITTRFERGHAGGQPALLTS
jgi:hypothetical protein